MGGLGQSTVEEAAAQVGEPLVEGPGERVGEAGLPPGLEEGTLRAGFKKE